MSWLADLAGKAEDFLNKVDQSAAVVLQENAVPPKSRTANEQEQYQRGYSAVNYKLKPTTTILGKTATPTTTSDSTLSPTKKLRKQIESSNQNAATASSFARHNSSTPPKSPRARKTQGSDNDDEKLLEFLNNGDLPVEEASVPRRKSPTTVLAAEARNDEPKGTPEPNPIAVPNEETKESPPGTDLLRNEVSSLNHELSHLIKRANDAEAETKRIREQTDFSNASHGERIVKELQARESDLQQALAAKDSQLAILRVRLQEADQELGLKRGHLESLQTERERILQDHTDSSGLHTQTIQMLKEKVEEMESTLERERNHFKMMQQDADQRLTKLEEERKQMCASLMEVQQQFVSEKARTSELTNQLRTSKNQLENVRRELTDYKQKAQKILQSKEKLIANLKESSNPENDFSETAAIAANVELEETKQERDMLREELHQTNGIVEQLRNELQDLESQMHNELELANEQIRNLEEQMKSEMKLKDDGHQDNAHLKEELQYYKEELGRQKNLYQSRLSDRDSKIEKLHKQLTMKVMNNSQSELESRLHALTESLIQKQTMVEALSTEKSSLVLQLERLEQQMKESQSFVRRGNVHAVNVADDANVKARIPDFLMESPFDGRVTRRVKRAYSTLDTFSVQLGIFLRRYPGARVVVLIYMMFLHLLVITTLLTYSPEIHDKPADKR